MPVCSKISQIWQGHPIPERLTEDNGLRKHHDSYTMHISQTSYYIGLALGISQAQKE